MKILISKCLLGEKVRWNGGQKLDDSLLSWALKNNVELVPVCPENDLFGTPRSPIRLVHVEERIEASYKGKDVSTLLENRCKQILLENPDALGFIGVSKSPTCGISVGVKNLGSVIKGYFHKVAHFPTVESGQLRSEAGRDLFLKRIKKYKAQLE